MCGRYLLDDEAYADILMILNNLNAAKKIYSEDNFSQISNTNNQPAANPEENFILSDFPRGEVFPSNTAPVFEREGLFNVKWGFPHWKNPSVIINARSETAAEKSMFKKPLRERRCVVPSGGFYEWSRTADNNQSNGNYHTGAGTRKTGRKLKDKYLFRRPGEHMIYMAGIVGSFKDAFGEEYSAFAILTTAASKSVARIHDRMPVLLTNDEFDLWINDDAFMQHAIKRAGQELSAVMV